MKKNIKLFVGILIGIIISTLVGVTASALYNSSEIGFTPNNTEWKVNNLSDAINDLYANKGSQDLTYIVGSNNSSTGVTTYTFEHDNDKAIIISGQVSLEYSINSENNYKAVTTQIETTNYQGRATYYEYISVKQGDVIYLKRNTSGVFGYIIVY